MTTQKSEHRTQFEAIHVQVQTLTTIANQSESENQALHKQIQSVQQDYEGKLREHQESTSRTIQALEAELAQLGLALEKSQHDLAETHAVNASLNQELTSALMNAPTSPRSAKGTNEEELRRLEQALTLAQNNAEWLKRENNELEQRCLVAYVGPSSRVPLLGLLFSNVALCSHFCSEQKIGILLDHMEGTGGEGDFGSESESQLEGGHMPRSWSGVASDAGEFRLLGSFHYATSF